MDSLVRIWDLYLLEGQKTIYRVAIAILKLNEDKLLKGDLEQCLLIL